MKNFLSVILVLITVALIAAPAAFASNEVGFDDGFNSITIKVGEVVNLRDRINCSVKDKIRLDAVKWHGGSIYSGSEVVSTVGTFVRGNKEGECMVKLYLNGFEFGSIYVYVTDEEASDFGELLENTFMKLAIPGGDFLLAIDLILYVMTYPIWGTIDAVKGLL